MSTTDEREAYQGDEQDFRHKQSLRTDAATSHNDQYDTTPPAPAHLESAMRKLREGAATAGQGLIPPRIYADECAALLAKIEAADRLAEQARLCIEQGEPGRYLREALDAYHNPAPAAEGE